MAKICSGFRALSDAVELACSDRAEHVVAKICIGLKIYTFCA